jgi:hypothetical protein
LVVSEFKQAIGKKVYFLKIKIFQKNSYKCELHILLNFWQHQAQPIPISYGIMVSFSWECIEIAFSLHFSNDCCYHSFLSSKFAYTRFCHFIILDNQILFDDF